MGCATFGFLWVAVWSLVGGHQLAHYFGNSYLIAFGTYYGGALVVGTIVGILKPLTRSFLGACAVGTVAAFPYTFIVALVIGRGIPLSKTILVATGVSAIVGCTYAWALWDGDDEG